VGAPFRRAHHRVGAIVTAAHERGISVDEAARAELARELPPTALAGLSVEDVATAAEHGGGPGPASFAACWDALVAEWRARRARVRRAVAGWRRADADLAAAAAALSS
jgi:argininosuccinate lyase